MEVSDLRMCLLRLFLLLVTFVISPVSGVLVSGPSDILSTEGATLHLSCHTNLDQPVKWERLRYGQLASEAIYQGKGDIAKALSARFSVAANQSTGFYNLTIKNVERGDAGNYTCTDNKGFGYDVGQFRTAKLTILAKDGPIGVQSIRSDSEIKCENGQCKPELLTLNCTVAFTSNSHLVPVITWRKITSSGMDVDLRHVAPKVTNTNSSVSSSVTLPVKVDLDGVMFRCEVKALDGTVIKSWTSTGLVFASTKSSLLIAVVVSLVLFIIIFIIIINLLISCWMKRRNPKHCCWKSLSICTDSKKTIQGTPVSELLQHQHWDVARPISIASYDQINEDEAGYEIVMETLDRPKKQSKPDSADIQKSSDPYYSNTRRLDDIDEFPMSSQYLTMPPFNANGIDPPPQCSKLDCDSIIISEPRQSPVTNVASHDRIEGSEICSSTDEYINTGYERKENGRYEKLQHQPPSTEETIDYARYFPLFGKEMSARVQQLSEAECASN